MDPRLKDIKKQAGLILLGQFAIVVLVAAFLWGGDLWFFYSAIAGGLAGVIPQAVFAKFFLVTLSARETKRMLSRFFLAEILKWLVAIFLLWLVKRLGFEIKAAVFGFIISQIAFVIAPMCLNKRWSK